MPERHLFLVATVVVPTILSLAQARCGLLGVGLCGGLAALLIYTLWQQPRRRRQAVAQQTQALMHAQAILQQQLADQTHVHATLRLAKEAAERANRVKDVLLVNVSHQLRMPLNAILGYSEKLQGEAVELAGQSFVADVRQIHAASLHLRALINDMLDLAKIEAGTMELCLETFDVASLLQDVVITLQPLVQQHDNTLEVCIAPQLGTMHADRSKLWQSLDNVLHYACTCTRHGTITLHATRQTVDDCDCLILHIRNTGPGISQEQIEYLWQDVVHSEATTARQYGGIGLGLALSQRVCRMMGGDITLTSGVNEGPLCTLRVPAQVILPSPLAAAPPVLAYLEGLQCAGGGRTCAREEGTTDSATNQPAMSQALL